PVKLIINFIVITIPLLASGQVTLHPGESYTFDFTLPFVQPANSDFYSAEVSFMETFEGWRTQSDFFVNTVSEAPFYSYTLDWGGSETPSGEVAFSVTFNRELPPPWPDLHGIIRVTSVFGTAQVNRMFAQEDVNGGLYGGWFYAVVPEPAPSMLF